MSSTPNRLEIRIEPSAYSNDHQVRFLVDGADLIACYWDDMLGLDPDDILLLPTPLLPEKPTAVTVARCSCGVTGCDSREVEIAQIDEYVLWTLRIPTDGRATTSFRFSHLDYREEVMRAAADCSWETWDRTAARLIREWLAGSPLGVDGLRFEWASGRAREGFFTVSFVLEPGPYQLLLHVPLSAGPPEVVARRVLTELSLAPSQWGEVEWHALADGLGAPAILAARGAG